MFIRVTRLPVSYVYPCFLFTCVSCLLVSLFTHVTCLPVSPLLPMSPVYPSHLFTCVTCLPVSPVYPCYLFTDVSCAVVGMSEMPMVCIHKYNEDIPASTAYSLLFENPINRQAGALWIQYAGMLQC